MEGDQKGGLVRQGQHSLLDHSALDVIILDDHILNRGWGGGGGNGTVFGVGGRGQYLFEYFDREQFLRLFVLPHQHLKVIRTSTDQNASSLAVADLSEGSLAEHLIKK